MIRHSRAPRFLFALLLLSFPRYALAQSQVIVTNVDTASGSLAPPIPPSARVVGVDFPQQVVSWHVQYPDAESRLPVGPVGVTHDGRQAMWLIGNGTTRVVAVRDLVTHAMSTISPSVFPEDLVAHPRRPAVFVTAIRQVARIEAGNEIVVTVCPFIRSAALSATGALLFVACGSSVEILSGDDLSLVRRLPLTDPDIINGGVEPYRIEVNLDATRFALADRLSVRLFDALNGTVLATVPAPLQSTAFSSVGPRLVKANADRAQLLVVYIATGTQATKYGVATLLDFQSLAPIATGLPYFDTAAFNSDRRWAVATQDPIIGTKRAALLDLSAGTVSWTPTGLMGALTATLHSAVAIASPPLAPVNISVSALNRKVTASWQLRPQSSSATRYHVDVRLSASGPVVATLTTETSTLSVENAPVGDYFLSVRAENHRGVGEASTPQLLSVR